MKSPRHAAQECFGVAQQQYQAFMTRLIMLMIIGIGPVLSTGKRRHLDASGNTVAKKPVPTIARYIISHSHHPDPNREGFDIANHRSHNRLRPSPEARIVTKRVPFEEVFHFRRELSRRTSYQKTPRATSLGVAGFGPFLLVTSVTTDAGKGLCGGSREPPCSSSFTSSATRRRSPASCIS